ncbi:hypothetical protein CBR_g1123 [Chara braunii]|uniref:HAT C-terminal dimerisation domain-containing protein n=1 Tax=Chara braunii TaxID=69332 RepID=A0A388KDI4_CHABU|nr:hypothetical protein CBR_g1123 [Chara braunii]|eukprot:GBG68003.1 hypothetical protein CBR_g1123 [Chara braunii]
MRHFHSRRGDWGDRQLSDAEAGDCRGDRENERCAAWWFAHGRHHPELRTIAIRVMHLWTSASPAERNWAQHERINTARRCKLGFAKLAQLVEIATSLKLAACAQQGGGYVLPWVQGTGREGTAGEEEDDEADMEPEVWGARPAGSVREQEIQQQVDVFGQRAAELRPWPEAVDDGPDGDADDDDPCDEWTDDDDAPVSGDATAERVYFTYGGGPDGMGSHTSVITDDVPSTGQASGTSRGGGRRGRRPSAADVLEQEPRGGLRTTGRRWEVRSDNEREREAEGKGEVPHQDRRYSPSHHRTTATPEAFRRSERLASTTGRERTHDSEEREGERTPSGSGIRPRSPSELRTDDFDVGHTSRGLGDFSAPGCRHASPSEVRTDDFDLRGLVETEEERDVRLDREEEERLRTLPRWEGQFAYVEEQRQQRDLETGGWGGFDADDGVVPTEPIQADLREGGCGDDMDVGGDGESDTLCDEGRDVAVGGRSPRGGGGGDGETAGDEGQGAAVCGGGEGGPGGDGDTAADEGQGAVAGGGGDDGPDGDDDDDHGREDDAYRLALVLRGPTVPPLRPDDRAHPFFDANALAQALTEDPFPHTGCRSGERRPAEGAYSLPLYVVQSPRWSGSSLSGVRGKESRAVEVGSGRRSEGGGCAGSIPPPPTRAAEAGVDVDDETPAPGVAHNGASPPPVRGGVGGRCRGRPNQATLDAIQRQRDTVAAQAAEDDDADTESEPLESVVRRRRAAVAAAAAATQAAYISGAEGTGAGGRGGRPGGQHGRSSSGRGRARPPAGRGMGRSSGSR